MLLGEHAVLHGHPCLVAAIDRRVRVALAPRTDGLVTVTSALGSYEGDRDDLPDHPKFRFVRSALRAHPDALPGGLDLLIEADMPPTLGFGTSAAVTVAVVGALQVATGHPLDPHPILTDARTVVRAVQGRGSGADVAASALGGILAYRPDDPPVSCPVPDEASLTAVYCGYKTPTPEVITRVEQQWANRATERDHLFTALGAAAAAGHAALLAGDRAALAAALNRGQTLMDELGVGTPELTDIVTRLRRDPGIAAAKISGSGLGDCAVGWGAATDSTALSPYSTHILGFAREGVRLD
jgi:mevalonate kinase